ncbi:MULTISPECIES: AMP-binding protein [unclassified Rhodococcus (in: high G+C Gram-positive bacteria)]|uniref:AMP-binding protein n=1 Tax=unclassified Rhodococcus (in: high G+C Gram-positive bacteria) TaxID=192944 RepID=UPI00163AF767|nr:MULTISPECIES: AMP-binding protein [unclassified Rhodococcus (in: high G+C Gram-positive bacteria)]MBC2638203.1 AMP-binding protein [Rhodococcus sp. 3A]MBC2897054.1 AMP-binding protein [Rhodococcus sp. 4CII]
MSAHPDVRVAEILGAFTSPDASAPDLMCDRHPADSVVFRFVDADLAETVVTFGDLAARSRKVASVLSSHGVGPGDRVATLMGKHVDLPAVILGIWRLGAVYTPLFTAFAASAVADRLDRGEVSVVVTDTDQFGKVPTDRTRLVAGVGPDAAAPTGGRNLARELAAAEPWDGAAPTGPDVELTHMFTSGTTGKPKTVVHPLSYAASWQAYLEIGLGVDSSAVYFNAADPGWAYGLYAGVVAPMCAGLTNIICTAKFDADTTWRVLEDLEVTDLAAAPTLFRGLRVSSTRAKLPRLQRLSSAGEPLTPDVFAWAEQEWGLQIHDHFGQTEVGMPAGFPHHPEAAIPVEAATMGRNFPGWSLTALSLHEDAPAPTGEVGRLAVSIPGSPFFTFTGYGADRSNRGDRFSSDGEYYLSGDLVTIDETGLIHFSSRDDDVILMAGYRIGPFDVESALGTHPAVQECAVVAAPDEMRGEVIQAFVVVTPETVAGEELLKELQDWVKKEYATHAYPRRIEFVTALPKTPSGKVQRTVLRKGLSPMEATVD